MMARDLGQTWVRDLIAVEILAAIAIVVAASPWPAASRARTAATCRDGCSGPPPASRPPSWRSSGSSSSPARRRPTSTTASSARHSGYATHPGPDRPLVHGRGVGHRRRGRRRLATGCAGGAREPTIWPGLLRVLAGVTIWLAAAHVAPFAFESSTRGDQAPCRWCSPGSRRSRRRRARASLTALPARAAAGARGRRDPPGLSRRRQPDGDSRGLLRPGRGAVPRRRPREPASLERGRRAPWRGSSSPRWWPWRRSRWPASSPILDPEAGVHERRRLPPRHRAVAPGATLMRLDPGEAEIYEGLVDQLQLHHCTGLIGYPSINSLYLWSGIEAPPPQVPGAWTKALDGEQQQRVVDELRASPRPCAVRSDESGRTLAAGRPPSARAAGQLPFRGLQAGGDRGGLPVPAPQGRRSGSIASNDLFHRYLLRSDETQNDNRNGARLPGDGDPRHRRGSR